MYIEHLAIWCGDLNKMTAFYVDHFGATAGPVYENPKKGFTSCFLTFDSGARLELMHQASIPPSKNDPRRQHTGLVHFAISVGSEGAVDELTARLAESGHEVLDGPRHTGDGYYESVTLDPEGNRVEITV